MSKTFDPATVEAVARALEERRSRSVGGCYKPDYVPDQECAEGECWCAKGSKRDAACILHILASRGALVPKGWVAVPSEPTEAMIIAGGHSNSEWLNDNAPIGEAMYRQPAAGVYRAMLAAAPPPREIA